MRAHNREILEHVPFAECRWPESGYTQSELIGRREGDKRKGGLRARPDIMLLRAILADQQTRCNALQCSKRELPPLLRERFALSIVPGYEIGDLFESLFDDGYIDADDHCTIAGFDIAHDIDSAEELDRRDAERTKEEAEKRAAHETGEQSKRDRIIATHWLNPDATHAEIARVCDCGESTVRKYRPAKDAPRPTPSQRPGESTE